VGDDAWHGGEGLEVAVILIGELEMVGVQWVLLEADAERIEDKLIVGELNIVGGPLG
jgi:hypothetical protein